MAKNLDFVVGINYAIGLLYKFMTIPVNQPTISSEAKNNIIDAVQTNWISSGGKFVNQFEKEYARVHSVKHAIAVSSGTAALHVALLSLGIKEGDEVIVPAFTMASSWMAILYTGAQPVFVDCELDTYNIDVLKIENKITNKTKAIMPVHIYGHPCEMDAIVKIAKKYNLFIIEDAAEAHGALYNNQLTGTFGDLGCFSFYGNKIITTGEGGMIITDNDKYAKKCRKIKDLHHSKTRFIHDGIGYNYRMTNMQAAIGCGELLHFQEYLAKKEWIASTYKNLLKDISGIITPKTKSNVRNIYWMYGIIVDIKKYGIDKDQLRIKLKESGIDTRDFFYPPESHPILKNIINNEKFLNAQYLANNGLYLPSGLALKKQQIEYICAKIKEISNN